MFFFLHRRYIKRQRLEDANDKHKSLDFGLDMSAPAKAKRAKRGVPEMMITDVPGLGPDPMRPGRRPRGMSLDTEIQSPYLLPVGLQGSRESIHSMSRSMQDEHDPYRPVALMRTSNDAPRPRNDNSSVYSASTGKLSAHEKSNLLVNAQRMSQSYPKRRESMSPADQSTRLLHSTNRSQPPSRRPSLGSGDLPVMNITEASPPQGVSLRDLKNLPPPPPPPQPQAPIEQARPPRTSSGSASRPPRKSSASAGVASKNASFIREPQSTYADVPLAMPVPKVKESYVEDNYDIDPSMIHTGGRYSIDTPNPSQQYPVEQQKRVSVMGLRPLPPDLPEDNPEIRANRIRSFYKEYFDDSRPNPAHGHYEEDYDANYMEGAIYDPETGGFVMAGGRPWAQPTARRAMTPPPRGAPRVSGSSGPVPRQRGYSTMSAGRSQPRGRPGPDPAPPMPKKRAPPPMPLHDLPTPHKMGYDGVISSPLDFAPPTTFRQMQNGSRPGSPAGNSPRPYSPSVRAFTPLASAYDDLAVMPSPHLLRKSGTFTGLDFAPPPKLRQQGDGGGSDAGSIRSARSGISAMQLDAVRAGAYRVSRIPKEMVTTREDLASQLRPRMDLSTPA